MDNISIDFKYKLINTEEWIIKHITVEEYFDLSLLEDGEKLEIDSMPLHDNLIDYFNCKRQQINQISIDIMDMSTNNKLQFFQTFWNEQKNFLVERIDTIDGEKSHEIIISTDLPFMPTQNYESSYEIMRFSKKEHDTKCTYHVIGFIHDNQGENPSDVTIEPKEKSECQPLSILTNPSK